MSMLVDRLERLPFGRFHVTLLLMGGGGFMFEAVDAAIIAFILPVIRVQWNLTSVEVGLLGSSTYIGFLAGALAAGVLGDRFGRRVIMMSALVVFCVMTLANAFADDWHTFLVLRALAGTGMGAEAAIIAPFVAEFVPSRYRGRFTGALAGFFSFGFVTAALIGYFVIPLNAGGWRWALMITAAPVVVLLWWRKGLRESPRWLESRGRSADAEAVVAEIERTFTRRGVMLAPPVDASRAATVTASTATFWGGMTELWSPPLTRITFMTWCLWLSMTFCTYAFFVWIPGLLVQEGMTITKSFSYSITIYLAQIPGYFSAAYFNDRIGRKATIVTYMFMACVSALGLAIARDNPFIVLAGIALSFSMNGVNAGLYAYTPELFPTPIRATGMGAASAFGRIGAIASPMLVGYLYPLYGFSGVFGMTTIVLLSGALAVLLLGVSTAGRSLEEISEAEHRAHASYPSSPKTRKTLT